MTMPKISSPFHIVKRMDLARRDAWKIRIASIIFALLCSAILCTCLSPGNFGTYIGSLFEGTFGTSSYIFNLLCLLGVYLLLALAVTPAFKMKFWNIGAEGQAMASCIVTAVILLLMPSSIPDIVVIIFALIAGVAAGALWAFIPAFFKIKFNTNETLFTLMMNYVAIALADVVIALLAQGGTQQFPTIPKSRTIVTIGGIKFLPFIIAIVLVTAFIVLYIKKSKHGFELSVLGDSANTARYVGMNINKVAIRTMLLSGAIAGLVGFLLVCGRDKTLSPNLIAGRGFTSVLIAWLGHFNPSEIVLYSFLITFLDQGTTYAASQVKLSKNYFAGMIIGLFIIIVVIAEFFTRYQIKRRLSSELSGVKDKVLNASDKKVSKDSLFKEFYQIGVLQFASHLSKEKKAFKTIRKQYYRLKRQIVFTFNKEKKKKLLMKFKDTGSNYLMTKKQYITDKKVLRTKIQSQKTIVKANALRVKNLINKKMDVTLLALRGKAIVYANKTEINNFLKQVKYTTWPIPQKSSLKNIFIAYKQYFKQFKNIRRRHNSLSSTDIQNYEKSLFNYWLIKGDYFLSRMFRRAKFEFALKVKWINARNLRLDKKQGVKKA